MWGTGVTIVESGHDATSCPWAPSGEFVRLPVVLRRGTEASCGALNLPVLAGPQVLHLGGQSGSMTCLLFENKFWQNSSL